MKKFMFQAILLLGVISFAIYFFKSGEFAGSLPFLPQPEVSTQVVINNAVINAQLADTQEKRSKGLGGRESIATDEGMLFIFPQLQKSPFWMKGLKFPLDFIWINGNTVVDLMENIQPPLRGQSDASLPIYAPKEEADKVLEVTAGTIQKLNIKVGDKVQVL